MEFDLYSIAVFVIGFALLGLGIVYLCENKSLIKQTGHTIEGMTQVVGGRYFMMALLIAGLYKFADRASLGVAFACFAGVALLDILIEKRRGGKLFPHLGAAVVSVVMSVVSFDMAEAEGL